MESQKYSLSGYDFKRLALHLLWYAIGYGIIAALREVMKIDLGDFNSIVGLVGGSVIDAISRFVAGK